MSKDFMSDFSRLMDSNFERYAGCLIRIQGDKYIWEDVSYASLEEVKAAIDKAGVSLGWYNKKIPDRSQGLVKLM